MWDGGQGGVWQGGREGVCEVVQDQEYEVLGYRRICRRSVLAGAVWSAELEVVSALGQAVVGGAGMEILVFWGIWAGVWLDDCGR